MSIQVELARLLVEAILVLGIVYAASHGFRQDVLGDAEMIGARLKGLELEVTNPFSRFYRKVVAAVAGAKAGWRSVVKTLPLQVPKIK